MSQDNLTRIEARIVELQTEHESSVELKNSKVQENADFSLNLDVAPDEHGRRRTQAAKKIAEIDVSINLMEGEIAALKDRAIKERETIRHNAYLAEKADYEAALAAHEAKCVEWFIPAVVTGEKALAWHETSKNDLRGRFEQLRMNARRQGEDENALPAPPEQSWMSRAGHRIDSSMDERIELFIAGVDQGLEK